MSQHQSNTVFLPFVLLKVSGKSGWKVNGTWLFGSFQWRISGSNGTSEKVVLFSRSECSKRKFLLPFFKAIFDSSFRVSWPFSGKWNWFVQIMIAIPARNLPVPNFAYYYLPKVDPTGLPMYMVKQPLPSSDDSFDVLYSCKPVERVLPCP